MWPYQSRCNNAAELLEEIDARILHARSEAQSETQHRNAYLAERDAVFTKSFDDTKTKKVNPQRTFGSKARGHVPSEAFDNETFRLLEDGKDKDEAMVVAGEFDDDVDAPPAGGKGHNHPQTARATRSRK